jgi:hypothetical protein
MILILKLSKRKIKKTCISTTEHLEIMQEHRDLTQKEHDQFTTSQVTLDRLFDEKGTYWQQRIKLKWVFRR